MTESRFIIGIDLGTTNSTLSCVDTEKGHQAIETFQIPQLVSEGTVRDLPALASSLYLPGEYDLPKGSIVLPWDADAGTVVGEFARVQGSRVPANLVSSAKSWLCHSRVDRRGPILPWGRESAERRVSPVEASSYYLRHMRDAWNHVVARGDEDLLLERQQIIITIPASFDETARELTAEAVRMAGIEAFTMLEEPQAAFYAWISSRSDALGELRGKGRLLLVFDVGGGTTDFTLIRLQEEGGAQRFTRVAVGDHLMLGGDNMDLALAKRMEERLGRFDHLQWLSVIQQCRSAKEEVLAGSGCREVTISVLGGGRGVVGGSREGKLTEDDVRDIIIDGFYKEVGRGEEVVRMRSSGFQELGLPYESDTAIMRHLSTFLKRHSANEELRDTVDGRDGVAIVRPDLVLFNGGVFGSGAIRDHAAHVLRQWFSDGTWSLAVLENDRFEHAVSIGAAYYGLVLRGRGERVSGGTGKAYYIGVETPNDRVHAAFADLVTAVCIVPRGVEEGEEIDLSDREFQVMTNSPVSFTVYASSYRSGDKAGSMIVTEAEKGELIELPPIRTILRFGRRAGSTRIPVSLRARVNEFGTLDVWCVSRKTPHRWKLAFHLRGGTEAQAPVPPGGVGASFVEESALDDAAAAMDSAFRGAPHAVEGVTLEGLVRKIETALQLDRNSWPLPAIRMLWDRLITLKEQRRVTSRHEARWLNLSGFLLRPGFGYQLDEWRMRELWKVFSEGLEFSGDAQCRIEWWIMWRRVAGGLDDLQQDLVFKRIAPSLLPSRKRGAGGRASLAEVIEMWMLASSMEHLAPSAKADLGNELVRQAKKAKGRPQAQLFWALSRVGARVPFHGPIDRVCPREAAETWLKDIMKSDFARSRDAVYTVAQLARRTNDRIRDIDEALRGRVIENLRSLEWAGHLLKQVEDVVAPDRGDETAVYGESLPPGLYIVV